MSAVTRVKYFIFINFYVLDRGEGNIIGDYTMCLLLQQGIPHCAIVLQRVPEWK